MAKTFITSGTGVSQTLDAIQNEKVPVYNTRADAEADIANIVDDGFVFTKDTGATEKVVDVVQDGNMNPVTSNGVFDFISSLSGVTNVGDWRLIRLGNSNLYLGLYYHTNITPNIHRYSVPLPTGYSCVQHYFGQCFQEGYTENVTGATHTGSNDYAMIVYFKGSEAGQVYEVRACCLFQKNS